MTRLVVCDVDGTLLQKGETEISRSMFEIINKLADCGVLFAVASGRPYEELQKLFAPVADHIVFICLDGAQTLYRHKPLFTATLPREETIRFVRDIWNKTQLNILVAGTKGSYYKARTAQFRHGMQERAAKEFQCISQIDDDFLKLVFFGQEPISDAWIPNSLSSIYQDYGWQEFVCSGTNKGRAVEALQQYFFIARAQCLAFGDNDNDIEMLQAVTGSFAMEHAKPDVKSISRHTTNCVEDTLNQMFFNQLTFKRKESKR